MQRRIGYRRIAREGSYPGRIRVPFNSSPLRSYDAAGGGCDSIELKWGELVVAVWEIIFFKAVRHLLARGNNQSQNLLSQGRVAPLFLKWQARLKKNL